jgi:hypothetical protein
VPTTTGASIAAAKALPALVDIFGGMSVRVPTPVVSLSDFAIVTKKAVTVEEVNEAFKKAAADPYFQGILAVTEEELVSTDFIGNSHSAIVDLALTNVVGGNLLKVVAWYDNEWGYSNRLVELTADAGKLLNTGDTQEIKSEEIMTNQNDDTQQDESQEPEEPKLEELLEGPKLDSFLPPAVGQTDKEPHATEETHKPVEGSANLGLETPAEHQPGPPAVFPETDQTPADEHKF